MRRLRAGLLLALLGSALASAEDGPADRFLAAFRAKDEKAIETAIQDAGMDLFNLASELFARHVEAARSGRERGDLLDAAAALAERAKKWKEYEHLPALVERWKALGADDFEREARIVDLLTKLRAAVKEERWDDARTLSDAAREDLDRAPWSMHALLARAAAAQAIEDAPSWAEVEKAGEALGWTGLRGSAWKAVARTHEEKNDYPAAALALEQAEGIFRSMGEAEALAGVLDRLGRVRERLRPLERSVDEYRKAAAEWTRAGNPQGAAASKRSASRIVFVLGRLDEAIEGFREALAVLVKGDDAGETVYALQGLGDALVDAGKRDEGIAMLERALELGKTLPGSPDIGFLHSSLGSALGAVGRYSEAIAQTEAAIREHVRDGDANGEATALGNLGTLHAKMGNLDRAIELLQQARIKMEAVGHRVHLAKLLGNLGTVLGEVGRYGEAIDLLERSYEEELAAGVRGSAAATLVNLGALYHRIRDEERAREALERARAELRELGNRPFMATALGNLGLVHLAIGDPESAIRVREEALAIRRESGDKAGVATELGQLAGIHADLGHHEKALALYREALETNEALDDAPGMSVVLGNLAILQEDMGRTVEARASYQRAIAEARRAGGLHGESVVQENLARMEMRVGNHGEARAAAKRSLELRIEFTNGLGDGAPERLLDERRDAADLGIGAIARALAKGGIDRDAAVSDAVWLAEAGRGLQLNESLANRRALVASVASPAALGVHASARLRLQTAEKALADARAEKNRDRIDAAKRERDVAYRALDDAIARVERESRRMAGVVRPVVRTAEEIRSRLPSDTALVEYHLAESVAVAIVLTQKGAEIIDLGAPAAITAPAERLLDALADEASDEAADSAALYEALLRPLEPALAGASRLLVAADDVLAFLPFEALSRVEGETRARAVERWEFVYVPSGSVYLALLDETKDVTPGREILALGDPVYPKAAAPLPHWTNVARRDASLRGLGGLVPLPGTREEVEAIAALFPEGKRTVLLGEKATVAALAAELGPDLPRLRAFHLACHGHVDAERPWLSGLVLGGGEVLGLEQIHRLRIPTDLAVLSACETARGKARRGEGVMGLVRGFFFAGAPRVVVSDWPVLDESTRDLMVAFYKGMLTEGRSAAAALRAAKLTMLKAGGPRAHPHHWAAFVLWGLP